MRLQGYGAFVPHIPSLVCSIDDGGAPTGGGNPGAEDADSRNAAGGQKTFSQDEVDRIVEKRLAQQARKHESALKAAVNEAAESAVSALMSEHGLEADDLPSLAQARGTQTETERAFKGLKSQHGKLQKDHDAAVAKLEKFRQGAVTTEILKHAHAARSRAPDLVLAGILHSGRVRLDDDDNPIVLGESGDPDYDLSVEDYVAQYIEARPDSLGPKVADTGGSGSRPGSNSSGSIVTPDRMSAEEFWGGGPGSK